MASHTFFCIDGHTCGNPVRLVAGGGPLLEGADDDGTARAFPAEYDWIRTGLMFEPRGHDVMSGSILYPPTREDCDIAILFIETSGCLPMCGHGTIGTVTMAIEHGLIKPKTPGVLRLDTPAGLVIAEYKQVGDYVEEVRITNVPSFLYAEGLTVECPGLGEITVDVAYGGNFYAIVEPQKNFRDMADHSAGDFIAWSPVVRQRLNEKYSFVHPETRASTGCRTCCGPGKPTCRKPMPAMPCSTATRRSTARPAAPAPRRAWRSFMPRASSRPATASCMNRSSARCSRARSKRTSPWRQAGHHSLDRRLGPDDRLNTIFIDDRDPFAHGFVVT
jgi:4-hydroxyproline epimerase